MAKVVLGLSGGVDSSVAAYVLQQQGHEVIGLFMQNWNDTTGTLAGECTWEDDRVFAELVAQKLDIPFHYVDLSDQYRTRVVDYMFSEYEKGRTPNPDVLCNREIKFDAFMKKAIELGAEFVATGHYCRKDEIEKDGKVYHRLFAGIDNNKDQSYFLCQLSQEQLSKSLFPIGDIDKPEVRKIAAELQLATATRKDSQGICFVGKVDLPVFLQQKLKSIKGDIIEVDHTWEGYNKPAEQDCPYSYSHADGKKVGEHNGAHFFTIGQRKGLKVGGKPKPLFVIALDVKNNIIFVGQGDTHPGLLRRSLFIKKEEVHWVREDLELKIAEQKQYKVRIRYRQPLQDGVVIRCEEGIRIMFDSDQLGVTAGQFAVWYDVEGELIGSGVIDQ